MRGIYLVNAGLNEAPKLSLGFWCSNTLAPAEPVADSSAWAHCVGGNGVDAHEPVDWGPVNIPPLAKGGGADLKAPNCVACAGVAQPLPPEPADHVVVGRKSAKPSLPPRCLILRVFRVLRVLLVLIVLFCSFFCCFCFLVVTHPNLRLQTRLVRRYRFAFRAIPFFDVRFSFLVSCRI